MRNSFLKLLMLDAQTMIGGAVVNTVCAVEPEGRVQYKFHKTVIRSCTRCLHVIIKKKSLPLQMPTIHDQGQSSGQVLKDNVALLS